MNAEEDVFSVFIYRLFDQTNSKELIQILLDNGFDQWEQTSQLDELILNEMKISEQNVEIILKLIEEIKKTNFTSSKCKSLTIDIMMKGLNKKKEYGKKPPAKFKYGVDPKEQARRETLLTVNVLTLNSKGLDRISECIALCSHLQVLHLYDNNLEELKFLEPLKQLRIIYAQNNQIKKADCLQNLPNLEKLYLDQNCLQQLPILPGRLNLLSISQQRVKEPFIFTGESLENVSGSLVNLICENSNIHEIIAFQLLQAVTHIDLRNNKISSFEDIEEAILNMSSLLDLDLRGNPLVSIAKYRDRMVLMSPSLECLDFKNILQHERQFLINLGKQKVLQIKKQINIQFRKRNQSVGANQEEQKNGGKKGSNQGGSYLSKKGTQVLLQQTALVGHSEKIHTIEGSNQVFQENRKVSKQINSSKNFCENQATVLTKHVPSYSQYK